MSAALSIPLAVPAPLQSQWVTYSRTLQLCERSMEWLRQQVRAGVIVERESDRKLPNGRYERDYLVSTLPAHARQRFEAEQAKALQPVQPSLPLFGAPQLVRHLPRVRIHKQKSSEAERRQQLLEPILAMSNEHARRIYAASLRLLDGTPVDSQNRMVQYQIEQRSLQGEELSVRTVNRWLAAHRKEGIAGLARRKRADAGRSLYFSQPQHRDAACLVAFLHLGDGMSPGLSAQACYDMLCVQREIVGVAADDLPHYNTVRTFLAQITPALKVFATRGRKEFGERMLPYLSRAYNEPANHIWVSDTMVSDVEVMNDCIAGAKLGAPIRLRLTAIIDYRSRYMVGYSWAWEGSSASIASALRMAVTNHGPCELMYVDNGKDFCKVAAGALPGYVQPNDIAGWFAREMRRIDQTGVLGRLGIRVTHCIPHHPQSKHIERFFRTLHLTFCKLWHTYTGGKPSERPDQTAALMVGHRRAVAAGDLSRSHHPLASEFMASFAEWVKVYHHHRGHRGQGMNHRSPAEVFAQERNPNQRPAPRPEDLAWLLWDHKTVMVHECQVRVNKHDYAALDPMQARLMLDRNDRRVNVAYDPLDASVVAVLDDDNRLVTLLQAKRLVRMAPDDPETQKQIAAISQIRGHLTRGLKQDHLAIVRAGKQLGVQSPLDLMRPAAHPNLNTTPQIAAQVTPRKPRPAETVNRAPMYTNDLAARMFARRQERNRNAS